MTQGRGCSELAEAFEYCDRSRQGSVPRRIAILAEDYPPNKGGIAEYAANVAESLARQGHDVRVVAAHVSGDAELDTRQAVPVVRIGERDVRRRSLGILARWRAIRRFQNELNDWLGRAFAPERPDFALVTSVSVWADACRRNGVPYAVSVHGGDAFGSRADRLRSLYRRRVVRRVFDGARAIFCNSDYTAKQVGATGDYAGRTSTLYCGVSRPFLAEAERLADIGPATGPRLLTMTRLVPIKACDVVIRAIALLAPRYPGVGLDVAGDGPELPELRGLAERLGITARVNFLGYVADLRHKAELMAAAAVYVQSGRIDVRDHRAEAFGITFAEAGAVGRPSVGPDYGGVREVIEDGVTGLLTAPADADALAQALATLLNDSAVRSRMGLAARKRVAERFSYDRIAAAIAERMETVL